MKEYNLATEEYNKVMRQINNYRVYKEDDMYKVYDLDFEESIWEGKTLQEIKKWFLEVILLPFIKCEIEYIYGEKVDIKDVEEYCKEHNTKKLQDYYECILKSKDYDDKYQLIYDKFQDYQEMNIEFSKIEEAKKDCEKQIEELTNKAQEYAGKMQKMHNAMSKIITEVNDKVKEFERDFTTSWFMLNTKGKLNFEYDTKKNFFFDDVQFTIDFESEDRSYSSTFNIKSIELLICEINKENAMIDRLNEDENIEEETWHKGQRIFVKKVNEDLIEILKNM